MNNKQSMLDTLEWHPLPSGDKFYDDLERRLFINGSSRNMKLGFGHDIRKRETILITIEEDAHKNLTLNTLEDEIIEEDV